MAVSLKHKSPRRHEYRFYFCLECRAYHLTSQPKRGTLRVPGWSCGRRVRGDDGGGVLVTWWLCVALTVVFVAALIWEHRK